MAGSRSLASMRWRRRASARTALPGRANPARRERARPTHRRPPARKQRLRPAQPRGSRFSSSARLPLEVSFSSAVSLARRWRPYRGTRRSEVDYRACLDATAATTSFSARASASGVDLAPKQCPGLAQHAERFRGRSIARVESGHLSVEVDEGLKHLGIRGRQIHAQLIAARGDVADRHRQFLIDVTEHVPARNRPARRRSRRSPSRCRSAPRSGPRSCRRSTRRGRRPRPERSRARAP